MKVVIASSNKGKIKEFKQILEPLGYEILSAKDLDVDMDEVIETGTTFCENSMLKSKFLYDKTNITSIADDSGLVIDALPDILGVQSARFMGEDTPYDLKNKAILDLLKTTDNRSAAFHSAISIYGEGIDEVFQGVCSGVIAYESSGTEGFGYDPIFIPYGHTETFGSLNSEIKNQISHRAKALNKLMGYFNENI